MCINMMVMALISISKGRPIFAFCISKLNSGTFKSLSPINAIRGGCHHSPRSRCLPFSLASLMSPMQSYSGCQYTSLCANPSLEIISISDTYDSGNGKFLSAKIINEVDDDCDVAVNVEIRPDPYTELEKKQHFQYFSFRSSINFSSPSIKGIFSNKEKIRVKYIIQNAGEASYADAFNGYSTFVTTKSTPFDPESWRRTNNCSYENGCLTWTHVHDLRSSTGASSTASNAYFAYFPPYSYERHLGLIAKCEGENYIAHT